MPLTLGVLALKKSNKVCPFYHMYNKNDKMLTEWRNLPEAEISIACMALVNLLALRRYIAKTEKYHSLPGS